ncbi:MAG TPA: hypothetical protein DDZ80_29970 [Cyanobacteria bacterium UBA8803]|nr:hypothetical protein [Cyanobacteria bacterium UBA8803]
MPKQLLQFSSLLLLVIAIGILLRIINLGSREFWYDEVLSVILSNGQKGNYQTPSDLPVALSNYSAWLSLSPKTGMIGTVINILRGLAGDVHPPLSYLSFYVGTLLFGNGEAVLRGVVVLFSVGAILSAYGLGRTVLGHRGGLVLAALLAVNPFYLSHSLNARMYGSLVLWTVLSAWATLELREWGMKNGKEGSIAKSSPEVIAAPPISRRLQHQLLWSGILIISVTAGLLTQYLFVYWVMTLGIFVLIFDRRRWWQNGLCLGAGVLLWMPWFLWGTRQQLRNRSDVFSQLSQDKVTPLNNLEDVAQTLGTHLLLGDWATSLSTAIATVAGCVAIAVLVACGITLWRKHERSTLGIALVLGIIPLLLALAMDVAGKKLTVGFGWGRSMIFILPGCLLLLAVWLERAADKWRQTAAAILLVLYLSISSADLGTRHRQMFHQIADLIEQEPTTPTLIVMNSNAWGHVLRLAYYIPSNLPVKLLSQKSDRLAPTLEERLASEPTQYQRILWLDSARPVWGRASTPSQREQVQKVLNQRFKLQKTQQLSGTMELDQFTAQLYKTSGS